MELNIAIITYFFVVLILTICLLYLKYTIFSSFILSIIVGFFYLLVVFPMTRKELDKINVVTLLYTLIIVFTIVVLITYTFLTNIGNRKTDVKFPFKKKN